MAQRICAVEGCDSPYRALGMCFKHYQRKRTYGTTDLPAKQKLPKRLCSVVECESPYLAQGLCRKHYQRWKAHGTTEDTPRLRGVCSIDGCEALLIARGWCGPHYRRWQRNGDPLVSAVRPRSVCAIDGCDRYVNAYGLCELHHRRKLKGTDVHAPLRSPDRTCKVPDCSELHSALGLCKRHYYEAHTKPKLSEYEGVRRRKRQEASPEDRSKRNRLRNAHYQANRERVRELAKARYVERYAKDPAPYRAAKSRRKMRSEIKMSAVDRRISVDYRRAIATDPCWYCGNGVAAHVDHYFPLSKGGTDHWYNLVRACERCNLSKHARCGTWFILRTGGVREPRRSAALG